MRIGLNALYLIPGKVGGTEIYARNLIRSLVAACPNDEFVLYVAREAAETFPLAANLREVVCPIDAESRPARLGYEQTVLPYRAKRDGIDVLHSLGYTAPLVAPCPSVVTLHDLNYHFHPEDWTRSALVANRLLIPQVARRATRVLTISQSSRAAIRDVLRIPDGKIDVVYHGIDGNLVATTPADVAAVRTRFDLASRYLLTVTASHPHKNLDGLLAAYARLSSPPPLVVVGIRGRDHARLESAATHPGAGRVVVTGWLENQELASLYRGASAFVFASKYEGFGFPVLEAMSVGVPVASSNAASLPELVGDAGLLFAPTDIDGMASAMQRSLEDNALRTDLIRRGYERASGFLWARAARGTRNVYSVAVR
ncbi:MAG TPA: glycosyltransferase family 1 protein [Kofleriaceae bacterium]